MTSGNESLTHQSDNPIELTEDDLVNELNKLLYVDSRDDAFTCQDIQKTLGWSEKKVRRYLHHLDELGKLEVTSVKVLDLSRRVIRKPAYRLR